MYDFKKERKNRDLILESDILTERELFVFDLLSKGVTRKDVYEKTKTEFGVSTATFHRIVNRIKDKISELKNLGDLSYKVYIHIFPNGKKYVGVCQFCKDRWNSGLGYCDNKEMYDDIQKYGWENIEHKILFETTSSIDAYKIESMLIDVLDLINNGYNNKK